MADAERTEAHSRWAARNRDRKKAYHAEYDSHRDWADEAAHRDEEEKERWEEENRIQSGWERQREECERREEDRRTFEQRYREADELEAQAAEVTPEHLAEQPPTETELEVAHRFAKWSTHGSISGSIS